MHWSGLPLRCKCGWSSRPSYFFLIPTSPKSPNHFPRPFSEALLIISEQVCVKWSLGSFRFFTIWTYKRIPQLVHFIRKGRKGPGNCRLREGERMWQSLEDSTGWAHYDHCCNCDTIFFAHTGENGQITWGAIECERCPWASASYHHLPSWFMQIIALCVCVCACMCACCGHLGLFDECRE